MAWPIIAAAAANTIGNIYSGVSSNSSDAARRAAELNYEYGEKAADNAYQRGLNWYNDIDSPTAQRRALEAAGMNPNLMSQGANGAGGQQGSGAGNQKIERDMTAQEKLMGAVNSAVGVSTAIKQLRDAGLSEVQTQETMHDLGVKIDIKPEVVKGVKLQNDEIESQIEDNKAATDLKNWQRNRLIYDLGESEATEEERRRAIALQNQESEARTKKAMSEIGINEQQLKQMRAEAPLLLRSLQDNHELATLQKTINAQQIDRNVLEVAIREVQKDGFTQDNAIKALQAIGYERDNAIKAYEESEKAFKYFRMNEYGVTDDMGGMTGSVAKLSACLVYNLDGMRDEVRLKVNDAIPEWMYNLVGKDKSYYMQPSPRRY